MILSVGRIEQWAKAASLHVGCTLESPEDVSTVPRRPRVAPRTIKLESRGLAPKEQ